MARLTSTTICQLLLRVVVRTTRGMHFHMSEGTPLANLWLTQAHMMGVPLDTFADSTGVIHGYANG